MQLALSLLGIIAAALALTECLSWLGGRATGGRTWE